MKHLVLVLAMLIPACAVVEDIQETIEYSDRDCTPSLGTYTYTYIETSGNCGPMKPYTHTYTKGVKGTFDDDYCGVGWINHNPGDSVVEAHYRFNEDWTRGEGWAHLTRPDCESWYDSVIIKH